MLTTAPPVLPNSALKKFVCTLNSCTTSTEGWYSRFVMPLFCSTFVRLMPSSKTSDVELRTPFATKFVLDCPPALGPVSVNALTAADRVIVPVQAEYLALEGLVQFLETLGLIRRELNPGLQVSGLLITMHDERTRLAQDVEAELRERQEFAFEAAVRMRDRFLQQEVWERMGLDVKAVLPLVMHAPQRQIFQSMLFSKIVPNCKKLGLLDAGEGWLRGKFTEMGVIQFEDWQDTGEAYESLQATG